MTENDPGHLPRNPTSQELVNYRLAQIDKRLTMLMEKESYSISHDILAKRVDKLELDRAKDKSNTRTLLVGLGLALLIPIISNGLHILEVLQT